MNALSAYGLLAHALIFGALLAAPNLGEFRGRVALAATTLALLIGIAPGLHGLFGFPSLTLLQLALLRLAGRRPSPLSGGVAVGVLVFAGLFYGLNLSGGAFDPYPLGYQPGPILVALIPIAAALWWRGLGEAVWILAVDLLAYATGVFPNLWDVLIDPLLAALALYLVAQRVYLRLSASAPR